MKKALKLTLSLGVVALSYFAKTPAQAQTKIVNQSGNIQTEISYQSQPDSFCQQENTHLKISRNNQVVFDELINQEACLIAGKESESITIKDLNNDGEPEILIDWYTGGAHCCFFSLMYLYEPLSNKYFPISQDWFLGSYALKDENQDNIPEFHTWDTRFAYRFSSYANSGIPKRIWEFRHNGEFVDVTRQHPNLVYNDAYYWWTRFIEEQQAYEGGNQQAGEGFLAAYIANKALLGQEEDAWNRVRKSYRGNGCTLDGCVGREAFFVDVENFLKETGYLE